MPPKIPQRLSVSHFLPANPKFKPILAVVRLRRIFNKQASELLLEQNQDNCSHFIKKYHHFPKNVTRITSDPKALPFFLSRLRSNIRSLTVQKLFGNYPYIAYNTPDKGPLS